MVSNIPFGSYQPEWTDYLKTYSSIFGWNFRKVTLPFTFHPEAVKIVLKWLQDAPGFRVYDDDDDDDDEKEKKIIHSLKTVFDLHLP